MTVALSMRAAAYLRDFDTAATELRLAKDVARVHADQVREDDHTKYPEGFGSPLWDGRLRISGSADIHVAWLAHHYEEMVARYCNVAMTALTRTVDGQPVTIDDLRDADYAYRARSPVMPLLPPLPTREQLLALTEGRPFVEIRSAWLTAQEALDATLEIRDLEEALERLGDVDRDRLDQLRAEAANLWPRTHVFAQAATRAVVDLASLVS
jgi:hypothetical protein